MNAIKKFRDEKISAVIRTDDKEHCWKAANALIDGGIKIIEVTVENPDMFEVVKKLVETTEATIIAGGIITARQAQEAIAIGVKAIVSPIFQPGLVRLCQAKSIPIITTATTPNEAYQAWKARVPLTKIFPSAQMGGAVYISDLLRPMPFLHIIATGNIKLSEISDYLKAGAVAVTIGRDFWMNASYQDITAKAKAVVNEVSNFK